MIKFIKRNFIISIFGLVSVLISFSYAITYYMPDCFGIENWYSLFNNLSISYIAALIFYVLQVYIPKCDNSKRAQVILEPLFLDLIKFMEITVACCRKYVSMDENGKISINWWDREQNILYFVPIVTGSDEHGNNSAIRKTKVELRQINNIYKSKIKEIKERIDFRDCDPDILSALSKLESTEFFRNTVITALMFDRSFVGFSGFYNSVDQFEIIKDEFKKCCGITYKYEVRDAEDMEIALNEVIFYKNALQVESIDAFNEAFHREFLTKKIGPMVEDKEQLNQIVDSVMQEISKSIEDKTNLSSPPQ